MGGTQQPSGSQRPDNISARRAETIVYESDSPSRGRDLDRELTGPSRIGRYVVLERLGTGGMGHVWTAYDPKLDRKVALKLLRHDTRDSRHVVHRARLLREAQALAKLSHPNVVTVHDVDSADGRLYMAMEFVEGVTVTEWLEREQPGWKEILAVYIDAGRGLAAAHAQDITHRDVKPSNVVIGSDHRVRVLDFGLAKDRGRTGPGYEEITDNDPSVLEAVESAGRELTQAGRVLGTPAFMAPEQLAAAGKVGPATDQFGLAVSIYDALYDKLPFSAQTLSDRHHAIMQGRIEEPPRDSDVPQWVFRVLKRALSARPEERYPSMDEFVDALANDPAKWRRRMFAGIGLGGVGFIGTVFMAVALANPSNPPEQACRNAAEHWAESWNRDQAHQVLEAFRSTGIVFAEDTAQRVDQSLEGFGDRWISSRTRICEATRVHAEQSEALLDVRMNCLDDRRREVDALVRVFMDADADVVERAIAAVYELLSPILCEQARPSASDIKPSDPRKRAEIETIERLVLDAKAQRNAGHLLESLNLSEEAVVRAKQSDYPPVLTRALLSLGRSYIKNSDLENARQTLQKVVKTATDARDTRSEAYAWAELLYVAGARQVQTETADAWRLSASTALVRAQDTGPVEDIAIALRLREGVVDLTAKRYRLAEQAFRDVIRMGGDTQKHISEVTAAWLNLGIVAMKTNRNELAREAMQKALVMERNRLGERHPRVAEMEANFARFLDSIGETDDAEQLARNAVDALTSVYGSNHPGTASAKVVLGFAIMSNQERQGEAEALFVDALPIIKSEPGLFQLQSSVLANLAKIAKDRGDYADSYRLYRESFATIQVDSGVDLNRPEQAHLVAQMCEVAAHAPTVDVHPVCSEKVPVKTGRASTNE